MRAVRPELLLWAWEAGRQRHPIDRALMLHALAEPDLDPETIADEPLGRRNAALLELRVALFGSTLRAVVDCPQCGELLELETDVGSLTASSAPARETVEIDGLRFRLPTSRDLAAILGETDLEAARLGLLRRCSLEDAQGNDEASLTSACDRAEDALEAADPLADVTLALDCKTCGHGSEVTLDAGRFLWDEIDVYARTLLDDVHLLARAYGWSETEILALSEARRAAYLDRVRT